MKSLLKLSSALVFTALVTSGNALALTSSGSDGLLSLSNTLTLNASNNQVFNFTTIDLLSGSTLDFSGLSKGDSVLILGTGDISINGAVNLPSYTNFTFETTGNILIGGSLISSNSNLIFTSSTFQSLANSLIDDKGGHVSIFAGSNLVLNGSIDVTSVPPAQNLGNGGGGINLNNPPSIQLSPVPEPSSFLLLALGLLTMTFVVKKPE